MIRVILIDMQDDDKQFLEAVKTGVIGYLLKDASTSDVIVAVSAAYKGEAICPPKLCTALFQWVAESAGCEGTPKSPQCPDLTSRQRQLIDLVGQGLTNKEIANHLNLSEFTVRNHIHRILKLAHVETRREAAEIMQMANNPNKIRALPMYPLSNRSST